MKLNDRAYGVESTPHEIKAIKERVFVYHGNVLVVNQLSRVSVFATELLFEKIKNCTKDFDTFHLIIDLSKSSSPDAEYRAVIKTRFQELTKLKRVAVIAEKYSVLAVTAKFISLSAGLVNFKVQESFEQALQFVTRGE